MGRVRYNTQRGRWMLDYEDPSGRRVRESVGPKTTKSDRDTKKLGERILREREGDIASGRYQERVAAMPFCDYARTWLEDRRKHVRENSYEAFRGAVMLRLIPAFGDTHLDAITPTQIKAALNTWADTVKRSTANHSLGVLKNLYNSAMREDLVTKNPAAQVRPFKEEQSEEPQDEVRALNHEQITRLLDATATVAGEPWLTLFQFALNSGMRRNEVLGLQWRDLDLDADPPMVYLRRQLGRRDRRAPLKTKTSSRDIDITPGLAAMLRNLPRGDDPNRDFVFLSRLGNPIDTKSLYTVWGNCLTAAGLPGFTFHVLRHTMASVLLAAGADLKAVQYRLGHASISMTLDRYSHFIKREQKHTGHLVAAAISGNGTATERGKLTKTASMAG